MISQLILPQRARARPLPTKHDATGLPSILFCCLSHVDGNGTPILVASCSADSWSSSLKTVLHTWRNGRFQAGNDRDRLHTTGTKAMTRFGAVLARVDADWGEVKDKHGKDSLTNENYNYIGRAVYTDDPELPANFGFNHLAEVGRPFFGSGKNMFDETSRCWNCRFVHHYDVNAGLAGPVPQGMPEILPSAVVLENPRLTKLHANGPLGCAEDLVHFQCNRLPAVLPAVPMPAVPPPVI